MGWGKGRSAQQGENYTRVAQKKKKKKTEFFRTLENKEKGFFFFLGPGRGVIFAQLNTLFYFPTQSQFGRIRGNWEWSFFSSVE